MKAIALGSTFAAALLATSLTSTPARAWGLHAGDTVGTGDNFVYGEVGWPGLTGGFAHGFNDRLEIGGRADILWGFEGSTLDAVFHNTFGLGLAATVRYTLLRSDKFSAEVHVFPGLRIDSFQPVVRMGLQFPVGIEAGYHLSHEATVSAGFDLGLFGGFTNGSYFVVAPEVGPGFEYHVSEHLTLGAVTRLGVADLLGPAVISGTAFAFRLQGFVGYRL